MIQLSILCMRRDGHDVDRGLRDRADERAAYLAQRDAFLVADPVKGAVLGDACGQCVVREQ